MTNADGHRNVDELTTGGAAPSAVPPPPTGPDLDLQPLGHAPLVARWGMLVFLAAMAGATVVDVLGVSALSEGRASVPIEETVDPTSAAEGPLALVAVVAFVAVAIAWPVTLWRMADNGKRIWPERARLGSIFAIIGWVIPIAVIVLPYVVTVQVWDTSRSRSERRDYERAPTFIRTWWIGVVVLAVLDRVGSAFLAGPDTQGELLQLEQLNLVVGVGTLIVGALFLVTQRALVARHERAMADPFVAPITPARP